MLTLTDIKSQKLKTTEVDVEQWGGSLLVKKLSVAERDELAEYYSDQSTAQNAALQTIVRAVVNEDGSRMFSDDDLNLLASQDAEAITALYTGILEFNGIVKKEGADAVKP